MPCDYKRYHPDWRSIRRQVIDQADDRCEFCGAPNHTWIIRDPGETEWRLLGTEGGPFWLRQGYRVTYVVLTVMHLDHNVANNDPTNLRAGCQLCHLAWDLDHHQRNAARTRAMKRAAGTLSMEGIA